MSFAKESFKASELTGIVLADLDHALLEEIGIDKRIHRIQVLKEIARLQSSAGVVCGVPPIDSHTTGPAPPSAPRPAGTKQKH